MSIPPLVCSTPPPPDQYEDDKDPEDFELNYNLSQDDDYDYGSFSTYSHFQSAISESKPSESPIINKVNNSVNSSDSTGKDNVKNESEILQWNKESPEKALHDDNEGPETDTNSHSSEEHVIQNKKNIAPELCVPNNLGNEELHVKKLNNEEEPNVEDLNLSVESSESNLKDELYGDIHSDKFESSKKVEEIHIPDMIGSINDSINEVVASMDNIASSSQERIQLDHEEKLNYSDMKIEDDLNLTSDVNINNTVNTDISSKFSPIPIEVPNNFNSETDDEFGDFDNFHVISDDKKLTIDTCVNPWGSNQPDSDFGAFEAHFDEAESTDQPSLFQDYEEKSLPVNQNENLEDVDDDFGDFDDFKSSTQETIDRDKNIDPFSQISVLSFHTSDNESQVLENINKILNEIFEEAIPVPENMFDGKLESFLCETWGHLLETDVRQPYIINWNSSFGQKSLLKALCIDSRNILFGPKWNSNMPKFAVNLSAAPLQPQKQAAALPAPDAGPDRPGARSAAWTDHFTADGQESKKENNAAAQKRPSDLNVLEFEPTLPSKSEKIYCSTIGIQPLRQISLPDTHIFTPTDSETPRSKTIHYDEPSVFLSQTSVENDEKSTEISISDPSSQMELKTEDDEDYSDFQDFKGSFTFNVTQSVAPKEQALDNNELPGIIKQLPTTSSVCPTGILQPIKLDPSIPTLNWPSPGEVKDTFDDFSEFASNTTWSNDSQPPNIVVEKIHPTNVDNSSTIKIDELTSNKNNDSFDDEFDTFQSALPTSSIAPTVPTKSLNTEQDSVFCQNISAQPTNMESNIGFSFSDIHTVKSEPISLMRPIDIYRHSDYSINQSTSEKAPKAKEALVKIPAPQLSGALSMPASVLQPVVGASQIQQNTTQILQPLSLESFSQINWPNPGIDLQDLSRFNPVETLNSLKSDLSVSGNSKGASPVHAQRSSSHNQEDDIWGEFVSSKPKPQQSLPKKVTSFVDDDEWTDFVSSPAVKPQNGLSTISLNVHTNLNMQKSTKQSKLTVQNNQAHEIPTLNYITPKSSKHSTCNDRHFQNL